MKVKKLVADFIKEKIGEYATAKKISTSLGISLSYVYAIARNERILYRKNLGRIEYNIDSFLKYCELSSNIEYLNPCLSKAEFDINNFYNWAPKNDIEKFIESLLIDELSEFTSVKKLVSFFGVTKSTWHNLLNENKIFYLTIASRKIICTRSLIPFLREAAQENF